MRDKGEGKKVCVFVLQCSHTMRSWPADVHLPHIDTQVCVRVPEREGERETDRQRQRQRDRERQREKWGG